MKYAGKIIHEIEFEYVRSRGPGGQNVNRTNSAAIARWPVKKSLIFDEDQKTILLRKLDRFLNLDGELLVRSDEFRDQDMNRKRCLEKIDQIITQAFFVPKVRKKTRPTRGSVERRHTAKKIRADVKKMRKKID